MLEADLEIQQWEWGAETQDTSSWGVYYKLKQTYKGVGQK